MPDDIDDDGGDGDLGEDATLEQVRAALNRERKRRKETAAEAATGAAAQRELNFLRAGVDTTTPAGKLFMRGYEGELDAEAIKASYGEVFPPAATPPPPNGETTPPANDAGQQTPGISDEEREELRRRQQTFQSGSTPPGSEPAKPLGIDIMDAAFEQQNPGGMRARPPQGMDDRAMNAGFSRLFARANEDDSEAVFKRPGETWSDATERWRRSQG